MKGAGSPASWSDVVELPELNAGTTAKRAALLAALNSDFAAAPTDPPVARPSPTDNAALLKRLLGLCPCLFNQIDEPLTARGVVHFCELALGSRITDKNVHQAYLVQHPGSPGYKPSPLQPCSDGGTVMEMLCSEVLSSAGIPAMDVDAAGWPIWQMPGHILLNQGKMGSLRALGDIVIPCAPTNLVISIKSEAARERLLYSANSIEGLGFGFFSQPNEFWTVSRMSLFKRMGFTAIYMPDSTHAKVMAHLKTEATERHAVNINGGDLYRPFVRFAADMLRVIGRSSLELL